MEITFKNGIPGFENITQFLIKDLEHNPKFKVLESMEEDISFVTVSPFEVYDDYEIELDNKTIIELDIKGHQDVFILSIITLGKTLETSTMNLKAPIVINIKNNLGKQIILQDDKYETKNPLIRSEVNVSCY